MGFWEGFAIGITIGALLAGGATVLLHAVERIALRKALITELLVSRDLMYNIFEKELRSPSETLDLIYPLETDYSIVSTKNIQNIGYISRTKLRNELLKAYILGKFFLDAIRANNTLYEEYKEHIRIYPPDKHEQLHEKYMEVKKQLKREFIVPAYDKAMENSLEFSKLYGKYAQVWWVRLLDWTCHPFRKQNAKKQAGD